MPAEHGTPRGAPGGPPPLVPFGLVLHHDGCWSHEGQPIRNRKLREHFDRSVTYLPEEAKFVVTLGHFRGEIEIEEAGFFVRDLDLETASVQLSDGNRDHLDLRSLHISPIDGALLCRIKCELASGGLLARFSHAAQSELLGAVEERGGELGVEIRGQFETLPRLEAPPSVATRRDGV